MILALLFITAAPMTLSIGDVLARVESFDPLARQRAFEQLRAEIQLRRAKWNQVTGNVGLNAGYSATYANWGILPAQADANALFYDRLTATLAAQLAYPIYAGGAIQGAIDAAEARVDAATNNRKTQVRDLKRAALVAYAQVIATAEQLEISTRSRERSHLIVEVAAKRKSSGMATDADVARARLNELRQTEDVEQKKGDHAVALAALRAALVLPQDQELKPSDTLDKIGSTSGTRTAGSERYEVLSLKSQMLAAENDRKVAFAGWLPRLELYANVFYSNGATNVINGSVLLPSNVDSRIGIFGGYFEGGVRLSWNVWDFFVTRDAVAVAAATRDVIDSQRADVERLVAREQAEASARLMQAEKRVEALTGGKETAETAVRLARIRYETGNAVLTEVLDAEIEAITVQARQVQASYDRAQAYLDKLRAEGQDL